MTTVKRPQVTVDLEWLRNKVDSRLDRYLSEMEPGYDDSITGFNEAWDIVRKVFDEEAQR